MPSELKVNKLSPYTGSTLTIGDSGDTISFASGVLPSLESLTITGDLTVDTNTLFVDSTNNNVGIGETTPLDKMHIYEALNNATATQLLLQNEGGGNHAAGIAFQVSSSAETTGFAPKAGIIFERTLSNGRGPLKFFNDGVDDTNGFSAGDEVMRIDSSGNVLIGTSNNSTDLAYSPKLKVSGDGPSLYLEETDSGQDWSISALGGDFSIRDATSPSPVVVIESGQTSEAMRIDSSGNVGIGTSSPTQSLDVVGNIILSGQSTADQFIHIGSGRSDNGYSFLDLQGDTTYSNGLRVIRINSGANSNSNIEHRGTGALQLITQEAGPVVFQTTAIERMRIDSSGNVGIGTNNPAANLDIQGSQLGGTAGDSEDVFKIFNPDVSNTTTYRFHNYRYTNGTSHGSSELRLQRKVDVSEQGYVGLRDQAVTFGYDTTESMRINSSGNVGIGTTSPSQKLHVNGGIFLQSSNQISFFSTGYFVRASTGLEIQTADYMRFLSNGANERMRIDSSGNVLVGKTSSSSATIGAELNSDGVVRGSSTSDAGVFYRQTATAGNGVILTLSDVGGTFTLVGAGFANGTFAAVSDINKKKNVENARNYLDDLMQIRVVKYNWKTDEDDAPKELGWIAQEVAEVFPAMVSEIDGNVLLKKEVFLPMMLKSIQELKADNDALRSTVADLTARLETLENT